MNAFVTVFYDWSRIVAGWIAGPHPLAVRITVGVVFMRHRLTKLQNLPAHPKNFTAMGHSAPEILTPFVSGVEFVGGLPAPARPPDPVRRRAPDDRDGRGDHRRPSAHDIDSLETLLGFEEVSYFVMFAWLAIAGPGPVSLDHLILKASGRDPAQHGA